MTRSFKFTEMIANKTTVVNVAHAVKTGKLRAVCDPAAGKFWLAQCPAALWDTAISEIKAITGYSPMIDDEELSAA